MNKLMMIAVVMSLSVSLPPSVQAATKSEVIAFQSELSDLNRLKPLQNPRHELAHEILDGKLIDRENKVIGGVGDILVSAEGDVLTLYSDLDRLRLGSGVFLNYADMDMVHVSNGYKVGMSSDELTTAFPELLANIETAAGDGGAISVKNILGLGVYGEQGVKLGQIGEILFDQAKSHIRGIYLSVSYKTVRNHGVAIPFNSLKFEQKNGSTVAVMDQDYADGIVKYVKDN